MNGSEAFFYPYKNMPKILTIVLGYAIIITCMILFANSNYGGASIAWAVLTLGIVLAQGLFLTGYGIRVILNVLDRSENLPSIHLGSDIMRGFKILLTVFAYCFLVFAAIVVSSMTGIFHNSDASILFLLLGLPFLIIAVLVFQVGMVRYALEDRIGVMFEFGSNWSLIRNNGAASFSLLAYEIAFTIAYFLISLVVDTAYNSIASPIVENIYSQNTLMIFVIISFILSTTLSIIHQVSRLHLLAQFAERIGLIPEKAKHEDYL